MNLLNTYSAKKYIVLAFIELLEFRSFEEISVKEIVTKAGISRSTFYLHFQDKYELMENIRDYITSEFISYYDSEQNGDSISSQVSTITLKICNHVYKYRRVYQHEFERPEFIQRLSNALSDKFWRIYADRGYAVFASFGTIGFLSMWVKDQFQINPEEAARQLMKIGLTDWTQFSENR